MDNRRNYYRILNVQPDAPVEIIKSSYRTLMQQLKMHPDLGGDHKNAALINEAFSVLTNPESRALYDSKRQFFSRSGSSMHSDHDSAKAMHEEQDLRSEDESSADFDSQTESVCAFCLAAQDQARTINSDTDCVNCGSPLCPACVYRYEESGQRAINRIPKQLDILFYTTWPQPTGDTGQTIDISLNGMSFSSARRLGEGRRVKICSSDIDAIAVVTHCQLDNKAGHWVVGVAFETIRLKKSQSVFFSAEA